VTLHPAKTARPFPLQGPVRLFGSAVDGHGGVVLLGDGEALHVDGAGRLERARFGDKVLPMLIFGNAVYDGDKLVWCDAPAKGLQTLEDHGRKQTIATPQGFDISGVCQLYRAGQGMTALQAFPYLAWQFDAKGQVQARLALEFPIRKPASAVRPCGTDAEGHPLGALWPHEGHDLALVQLGPDLLPGKTVWTLDYSTLSSAIGPLAEAVKSVRLQTTNGCTMGAGRAAFWTHNQVLVFHGNTLESWIRGSDKVDANNPHPSAALGPYASQILGPVHLLGTEAEPLLLTAERDQGDLKLFAPPRSLQPVALVAEAQIAVHKHEFAHAEQLLALARQGKPDDPGLARLQVENRLAAGWWEDAADLVRDRTSVLAPTTLAWQGMARALLLARWAERSMGGNFGPMPGQPDLRATYLAEAEQIAERMPQYQLPHVAVLRLARLLGKRSLAFKHLELQAGLLKSGEPHDVLATTEGHVEVPELFDFFASRGDVAAMERMVSPRPVTPDDRRWKAMLLRLQGKYAEALKILGDPMDDQPGLLALRAQVQVDAGDAQGGILTWTRALRAGLEADGQAHAGLGIAYLRRGLNELAVQALNKAVSLDPDDAAARSNLAAAYAALDKKDDAMQQLFGALAKNPKDPLLRWQLEQTGGAQKPPEGKPGACTVAILPLQTAGGATERVGLGDFAATLLTTALVEGGTVAVVERARLDALLTEQKLGRSAHVDHATAARLGKLLGAKQVVIGNIAEFDGTVALDLRLVDVQTGRVLHASHGGSALELEALRTTLAVAGTSLFGPKPSP
jgi:Flp pilus assembly protein TadD/TolB-like protein